MSFGRGPSLRGLEPVRPALGFRGVKTALPASV